MKPGVAEDDFEVAPGGRVTLARGQDVAPDALEESSHGQVVAPSDTTTGANRDEAVKGRLEAIGDSSILFFVPLDHQLVHHHDVAVRDRSTGWTQSAMIGTPPSYTLTCP